MKKYELINETINFAGRTLFRIRALVDIDNICVKMGDLGGYIENENNLSHEGNAWVSGDARIFGNAKVSGDAWVSGNAKVSGNARISGNAEVSGNAKVSGDARISGNAEVNKRNHVLTIGPIGSRNDTTTFFRAKENIIKVKCGCFYGTIDDFLAKVKFTHGNDKHGQVYRIAAELAKAQIELD